MLNYLKKFALEILPSVAATVIGAYIVNHYISKPADPPVAAAVAPAADAKKAKPVENAEGGVPQPGVKAKGISERAMMEKAATEQPGEFKPAETKAAPETRPAETASAPVEPRRHFFSSAPAPKAVAKTTPAPAASPAAPAEAVATTTSAPADGRDANDLARAAIERLRSSDGKRPQEAARATETPRVEAPRTVAPVQDTASVKPLPPPITVATPPDATATASIRTDDPNRPTPPADIPPPPPLDIKADAPKLATHTTNMAQDMLHAARSMLHAVIPGSGSDRQSNSTSSASQFTD